MDGLRQTYAIPEPRVDRRERQSAAAPPSQAAGLRTGAAPLGDVDHATMDPYDEFPVGDLEGLPIMADLGTLEPVQPAPMALARPVNPLLETVVAAAVSAELLPTC